MQVSRMPAFFYAIKLAHSGTIFIYNKKAVLW